MARVEFRRIDLRITVRRSPDGGVRLLTGHPDTYSEQHFNAGTARDWIELKPPILIPRAPEQINFGDAFAGWLKRVDEISSISDSEETITQLPRIILDIADPELASLSWERTLAEMILAKFPWLRVIVRVSPVMPRRAYVPFTVPLRILHIEPESDSDLPSIVRRLIGSSQPDEVAAQAVQAHDCAFSDLQSFLMPSGWPTAEVLHFDFLPLLNDQQALLTTASPEQAGTLGWFARVSDIWQTRLVIIKCHTSNEAANARQLASSLVNRGGPAVLVGDAFVGPAADAFFQEFYWQLLHDFPLDYSMMNALSSASYGLPVAYPSLFVGAGREEALRISALGLKLLEFEKKLSGAITHSDFESVREMRDLVYETAAQQVIADRGEPLTYDDAGLIVRSCVRLLTNRMFAQEDQPLYSIGIETDNQLNQLTAMISTFLPGRTINIVAARGTQPMQGMSTGWTVGHVINTVANHGKVISISGMQGEIETKTRVALGKLENSLSELKNEWPEYSFRLHESEGYIPLSMKVNEIRSRTGAQGPLTYQDIAPKVTEQRHINASLWDQEKDERLRQLDQVTDHLFVGEVYQLGIQIGPKDVRIRTVGETALIEEVFKWTPDMLGVWIEIGLVGLDFEVLGDPVQELWLPRQIATDMIYFAVSPQRTGVCRLRFCLYYQQNIIQSFRLAAITREPQQKDLPSRQRRKLLASALDLPQKAIGNVRYLSRLEYSLTPAIDGIESRPPRRLSIVANDLDNRPVVSVKGADEYDVLQPGDLSDTITAVRKAFLDISANKLENESNQTKWPYAFGRYAAQPETFKAALMKMAYAGWRLYDAIFKQDARKRLEENLKGERETIHVAHILLEKVIPWAAIYDRQFLHSEIDEIEVDGEFKPLKHDTCLAALPDANGNFKANECGTHPECLLHPDQVKKREAQNGSQMIPETVACPLHFWGFKHIIEIPPQQVDQQGTPIPQRDCILSGSSVQIMAGVNAQLKLWPQHWKNLEGLAHWKSQAFRRAAISKALSDAELDFIYLYCHAGGGRDDPAGYDPYLLFQDPQQTKPEKMRSSDFPREPEWGHHPLVFLNGCGTVGFSPDALSPFIKKLVDDLGAAGVIGTEVTVWEEFATVVAELFLKEFLAGRSAGEALLTVRRSLLANKNPLGLIYTLYAPAHLMLDKKGDGKCQKMN